MERLTEKVNGGYILKVPENSELSDLELKFNVYDKLGALEDAEEQGRLAILPCKSGDTVYTIFAWGVESSIVDYISIRNNKIVVYDRCGTIIGTDDNIYLDEKLAEEKYKEYLKTSGKSSSTIDGDYKLIDAAIDYVEKVLDLKFRFIEDFNEETWLDDACDNFYGYYVDYKGCKLSILYYEEEPGYLANVIQTVEPNSYNIGFFEYIDADDMQSILDRFIENLKEYDIEGYFG